jgi:hypothetical protein
VVGNFWVVSAPFLDVRKKLEKHVTSKCGVTLSVHVYCCGGNDDFEYSTYTLHNIFLDEEQYIPC